MSYKITCVDRRFRVNDSFPVRHTAKTVDTEAEAIDYCVKRNHKSSPLYMGEYVYHFFTPTGDEEE